jgi:TolB-like protein/class 3 adenylate cyclase/Tfp pilus assembly protein PilF
MAPESKLAVILHADIVGSTAHVQADERIAHQRFQDAFERLSKVIANHGGQTHEVRGDALVAEFARASDAVVAAVEFQAANHEAIEQLEDEIRPLVRLGIALGEVVIADNTVTGSGVVLAQRLEQLAPPGGVCISAAVREAVPDRVQLPYEDLGEKLLKGFERPQRAYSIALDSPDATGFSIRPSAVRRRSVERIRIAVLPFKNQTSDADQDFFADGLAEDLISALSRYRWFSVVSASSSFAYRDAGHDAREVSRDLAARYVVQGSVRRAGPRIRLAVELVDGSLGAQIWSMRYDREVHDVFDLQDELTQTLSAQLAPELSEAEQARALRSTPDILGAWEYYLRGLWHLRRATGHDAKEAERWLTQSIELDGQFSPAYSARAYVRQVSITTGAEQDEQVLEKAEADARAALGFDPQDPFAHYALGRVLRTKGRPEDAVGALTRAIELNPSFAEAYSDLGLTLQWSGKTEQSIPHLEHALELNPIGSLARMPTIYLGFAYLHLGRYEESVEALDGARALGSDFLWLHVARAAALGFIGRTPAANETLQRARNLEPALSLRWVDQAMRPRMNPVELDHLLEGLRRAGMPET